jgi:colicin import membrane protein
MNTAQARHLEFAPPPPHGTGRSLTASLIVHGLLLVALTAGINWKSDSLSAEAELWSAVPQAAAPKLVEVEPAPPPPPPPPKAVVKPTAPPTPDREAEIALAKKRKAEEEQKKIEAKLEEERRRVEELKKAEEKKQKELKEKLKAEEEKRKLDAQKEKERKDKELKEKERKDKEQREKDAKKPPEPKDNKQAAEEAKKLEAIRRENLKRIQGLAGASGDENATGTALKASGPSDSYGGRIRARVKPNIVFTEEAPNNNAADVEVRCAPDGTIVGRKLIKSSGNKAWDDAVLKAIDKTEVLPRDTDGRIHSPLIISFRPKD